MADKLLKLHDYQDRLANMMYERDNGVMVALMGAGKTLTTLTVIKELIEAEEITSAIIFAPLRVAQMTWVQEEAKFDLGLKVVSLAGLSPAKRRKALVGKWDVLVANYELAPWCEREGIDVDWSTGIFFDEITRMKSPQSKRRKQILKLTRDANIRHGMTGSPHANGRLDYWGMADAIQPGCWGTFYAWRARHFRAVDPDGHIFKVLPGCDELIDEAFAKICYTTQVPVHSDPVSIIDTVELPPKVMAQYKEFEKEMVAELGGGDLLDEVMVHYQSSVSIKLRQIAAGVVLNERRQQIWMHPAKLDAVREIAEDSGENCLIAYQFRAEVDALRTLWPDMPVLGGGTSAKDAKAAVEGWNRGEIPRLAIHPMSAAHGLNLQTGGRRLIGMSLPGAQEQYSQLVARLARQGQDETVFVHHVVARGTIDEKIARSRAAGTLMQEQLIGRIA